MNFADLPDDAAGGAGGCGNDKRFAFLRCGDFHSEKGSEAVDAENAKEDGVRYKGNLRHFLEEVFCGCVDDDVVLQAGKTRYAVAFLVIGMARFDDFGETGRAHDFTYRHNGKVSIGDHPDAHGRVDRKILYFREGLTIF